MMVKSPRIFKLLFPSLVWSISTDKKEIFLTFDDGPHPDITSWVLDCLSDYSALATFFCVGENVCKYPNVFNKILSNNHSIGNHTYNHLNGYRTSNNDYFKNIEKAQSLIPSQLFRPPYGRIKPSQIAKLKKQYKIIMWSVLSYDFNNNLDGEKCFTNSISSTENGSIVVFHDSLKASKNLKYALPKFLDYFSDRNYTFQKL